MGETWAGESIVIPAIGAASSLACLRSLGHREINTIAVSEQKAPPAFWSRYCDETVTTPSPTEDLLGYKNTLLSLGQRSAVRTIVPMRELDIYILSKYRSEFEEHITALWPSFEALQTVHDRVRLAGAARAAGVSEPNTQSLEKVNDWDRELIIKARYALLANEYLPALSPGEIREVGKTQFPKVGIRPDREAIHAEWKHTPVVQEHIPGPEYSFRALYDHGTAVATSQKRSIRGFKYARGPSVYHQSVSIPQLREAGLALLDSLKWHGLADVGFIRQKHTGEFVLLEINPRFWATLPCDIRAGVDFPYYYWRLAGSEPIPGEIEYNVGVGTHLLRGEVAHLYSILREDYSFVERPRVRTAVWEIITSLYRQPHFDYLSLDDPGPFVRDFLNVVTGAE